MSRTLFPTRVLRATMLLVFTSSALTACGDSKHDEAKDNAAIDTKDASVNVSFGDSAQRDVALGPNDVRIVSTDNVLVLALIGDTVRMQLTDSLRNSVSHKIDSSATKDGGAIGSMIAKTVGAAVSGAMGFVVRVPANDVQDLRYEDGHIRFNARSKAVNINSDGGDRGEKAVFSASDAKKFIDAVKKKQGASKVM